MARAYRPRIVDLELADRLAASGAVLIEGARAVGKTATARQAASSEVLLDVDESARIAADVEPALVLEGATPRLIDEWQIAPSLWNQVRRTVDERGQPGQFILTGSAIPADNVTRHTGAGRVSRMRMRPMSLVEVGRSTGEIALSGLLAGESVRCPDPGLRFDQVVTEILVGGWPRERHLPAAAAQRAVRDYLNEITHLDLGRVEGLRRFDIARVTRVIRSLARNIATEASLSTLSRDTVTEGDPAPRYETVGSYLAALEQVMIIEDQPAWAPHLRSRHVLRSRPKRHFVDPSLAAAALRATSDGLERDLRFTGLLFESLVIRDLRIYAQANDASVFHYRDSDGLEADAIVETADGRWAAFEIKMGQGMVDEAARNLLRLADRVDTSACGEPNCLGVVTSSGIGYTREDGVKVLPVGSLGP